jgi:hypothetical protein
VRTAVDRRPFASLTTIATAAKLLLGVVVLVDLAAAVSSFRLSHLADEAAQLGHPTTVYYDAEALESTHALIRTLQLGVYAAAGLVLALWFVRAYANLRAVDPDRPHLPMLVSPTRLAANLWRGSNAGETRELWGLHGAWWRTFAVGTLLVAGGSWFWVDGTAVVQLEVAGIAQLVGNLLGVASAVLTYALVDRTSKRQHERAAELDLTRTATSP